MKKHETLSAMASCQDRALALLDAKFQEYGFQSAPIGLKSILRRFTKKPGESAENARKGFYKCLFGILWFGNSVGKGRFQGKALPTYVYPECIKEAIQDVLEENLRDYQDPEGPMVYQVTVEDLQRSKWPAARQ